MALYRELPTHVFENTAAIGLKVGIEYYCTCMKYVCDSLLMIEIQHNTDACQDIKNN